MDKVGTREALFGPEPDMSDASPRIRDIVDAVGPWGAVKSVGPWGPEKGKRK